jgi:hypothetical protein
MRVALEPEWNKKSAAKLFTLLTISYCQNRHFVGSLTHKNAYLLKKWQLLFEWHEV